MQLLTSFPIPPRLHSSLPSSPPFAGHPSLSVATFSPLGPPPTNSPSPSETGKPALRSWISIMGATQQLMLEEQTWKATMDSLEIVAVTMLVEVELSMLVWWRSMKSMKAAYLGLITFLLSCIGIKYGISKTNPFHDSTLSLLVTAVFSHLIASAADMDNPNTILTFYFSGTVACEILLWTLIAQFSWFCLVNFLVLLILKFLFSHFLIQLLLPYFNCITHLLAGTPPNGSEMSNTEPQL
ncbi:hypothetical protein V8G54_033431 [Vigna mungo]|uniref:Transmembrane protein n=1 Tax=Vigna mungo TaxID=3915 RepID=A0AAQ3MP13_VIGMU